ncbi:hypothetical protein [Marinimicrobium agarilyticum]|nr:hypothetical protein [Marinimicrobium agarilyticum]
MVSFWLLDLTAQILTGAPHLDDFAGEGRWTINAAVDQGVQAPPLSAAL